MPKRVIAVQIKKKQTVMANQSTAISLRKLSDLIDVDVSTKTDGSILIYDEVQEKFIASTLLEKQIVDGGHF